MDWLTFTAKLVDALAWPAVVFFVFLVLRKPLLGLLPQVRKFRFKEFEAEFDRGITEIQARMADELPLEAAELPAPESIEIRLGNLASIAPSAAVMEAWKQVEAAAKLLISSHGHSIDYQVSAPYSLIERTLGRGDLIEPKKVKIFRELRQLRNKVAHADQYEPTADQAVEYVHAAMALARFMEGKAAARTKEGEVSHP